MLSRNLMFLIIVAFIGALSPQAKAVYNAEQGRWLTRDPLGYVDGPNVSVYARSQPIAAVDPNGTDICNKQTNPKPLLACGTWTTGNQEICKCFLLPPGNCCDDIDSNSDCDFFYWPGTGWWKCRSILQDCDPEEGDDDATRPWNKGDGSLRTWEGCEVDVYTMCAERCGHEAGGPDDFCCEDYDTCLKECLQSDLHPPISWPPCSSPVPPG